MKEKREKMFCPEKCPNGSKPACYNHKRYNRDYMHVCPENCPYGNKEKCELHNRYQTSYEEKRKMSWQEIGDLCLNIIKFPYHLLLYMIFIVGPYLAMRVKDWLFGYNYCPRRCPRRNDSACYQHRRFDRHYKHKCPENCLYRNTIKCDLHNRYKEKIIK